MKKFNLLTFGFDYTLFNNGTLTKNDAAATSIVGDKKGMVTLAAAAEVDYDGKSYKAGDKVKVSVETILGWVEGNEWESIEGGANESGEGGATEAPKETKAKKELTAEQIAAKENLKALKDAEAKAQIEVLNCEDESKFAGLRATWQAANKALVDAMAKAPKAAKTSKAKVAVVYTPEQQLTIDAYTTALKAVNDAKAAMALLVIALNEAKTKVPSTYKTKGNAGTGTNGGPKPPKMDDSIRDEIVKASEGKAYTAQGVEFPAVEEGTKIGKSAIARNFGYSPQYTALQLKNATAAQVPVE